MRFSNHDNSLVWYSFAIVAMVLFGAAIFVAVQANARSASASLGITLTIVPKCTISGGAALSTTRAPGNPRLDDMAFTIGCTEDTSYSVTVEDRHNQYRIAPLKAHGTQGKGASGTGLYRTSTFAVYKKSPADRNTSGSGNSDLITITVAF